METAGVASRGGCEGGIRLNRARFLNAGNARPVAGFPLPALRIDFSHRVFIINQSLLGMIWRSGICRAVTQKAAGRFLRAERETAVPQVQIPPGGIPSRAAHQEVSRVIEV